MLRQAIAVDPVILAGIGFALAAVLAWLVRRRWLAARDPVIGCTPVRTRDGSILLHMAVRNKLPEPVEVARVKLLRPRGASIIVDRSQGGAEAPLDNWRPVTSDIPLHYEVAPAGVELTTRFQALLPGFSHTCRFDLLFEPPRTWSSGEVRLAFCIATIAAPIRKRWITVRSTVGKRTPMAADDGIGADR